jgi:hypothetical protein
VVQQVVVVETNPEANQIKKKAVRKYSLNFFIAQLVGYFTKTTRNPHSAIGNTLASCISRN